MLHYFSKLQHNIFLSPIMSHRQQLAMAYRPVQLDLLYCLLVDLPDPGKGEECEYFFSEEDGTGTCMECPLPGRFLFGGNLVNSVSPGRIICRILCILIIIMSILGAMANVLVITVVRRRKIRTSFDYLLYALASVDLFNSVTSSMIATGMIMFMDNWAVGRMPLAFYLYSFLIYLHGKSASAYLTVLITAESYLVIANPIRSVDWFTARRTKLMIAGTILLAILINFPRATSTKVEFNAEGQGPWEYILISTELAQFWRAIFHPIELIDIDALAPFPILILFNVLLFIKISEFARKHQCLTNKQKVVIRAARMFVPVVVMLFLCNIEPITFYVLLRFFGLAYREMCFMFFLSVAVNSAVNLPIYYARGESFREEVIQSLPKRLRSWLNKSNRIEYDLDLEASGSRVTTSEGI